MWLTHEKPNCFQRGLLVSVALFSLCALDVANASCNMSPGGSDVVTVNVPNHVSTTLDQPVGTVLYKSRTQSPDRNLSLTCTGDSYGLNNLRGGPAYTDSAIFPIGETGLGFRWLEDGAQIKPYPSDDNLSGQKKLNHAYAFELLKIGSIQPGTSVPEGNIAAFTADHLEPLILAINHTIAIDSPVDITKGVEVAKHREKPSESADGAQSRMFKLITTLTLGGMGG